MNIRDLVRPEWIRAQLSVSDQNEAIDALSELLERDGVVKPGFRSAVKDRELGFPTGLPTSGTKVALPHTGAEHVYRSAVAIATLVTPVSFRVMGNPDDTVDVRIVFLLAIADRESQVHALSQLVEIVQEEEILKSMLLAPDSTEVHRAITRIIG
ncbi:MAG: PTS sugar transporter subunit IIA [Firmicutes bacterium]|nr:PTS sugar transporter subunit IIA [Bacillota bacterium]